MLRLSCANYRLTFCAILRDELLPILTTEFEGERYSTYHQHQPLFQPASAGNAFLGILAYTEPKKPHLKATIVPLHRR